MNQLIRSGLMPEDDAERQALSFVDPYAIRKKALDHQVTPFEFGRAIFHINQRRGFKSNRKSADGESGVVKQSIAALAQKLKEKNARTIGEFLADRNQQREPVRARRLGQKKDDLYELYLDRAMLENEFDQLWAMQAGFDSGFYTDSKKEVLKNTIFYQRPLKPQEVGKCVFLAHEDRCAKALPSFQRFRIYVFYTLETMKKCQLTMSNWHFFSFNSVAYKKPIIALW